LNKDSIAWSEAANAGAIALVSSFAVITKPFKIANTARKAAQAGNKITRVKPWRLTESGSTAVKKHDTYGKFYRSAPDREGRTYWWTKDQSGHGGSQFKVYKSEGDTLKWHADADEHGNFLKGKHKSPGSKTIPWSELHG